MENEGQTELLNQLFRDRGLEIPDDDPLWQPDKDTSRILRAMWFPESYIYHEEGYTYLLHSVEFNRGLVLEGVQNLTSIDFLKTIPEFELILQDYTQENLVRDSAEAISVYETIEFVIKAEHSDQDETGRTNIEILRSNRDRTLELLESRKNI